MELSQRLSETARSIDAHLEKLLGMFASQSIPETGTGSGRLAAAMRDSALAGGKRIRPTLVVECGRLFSVRLEACLNAAAAIECVHCYSLVHDDLPAMDNDALRRGKPSIWAAYDEWTAILAGDALLTLAFEILAHPDTHPDPETRLALIAVLSRKSGARGMAEGQALDLAVSKLEESPPATLQSTQHMQSLKTGALIEASCQFGGILAQQSPELIEQLGRFGAALGRAFQIRDDLLDIEGEPSQVGKATGKDAQAGKATLISLLGKDGAREELDAAVDDALSALNAFGDTASVLRDLTRKLANRTR